MSWQTAIIRKARPLPPRLALLAPSGVGKTTWGASLPKPLLIDLDRGSDQVMVDRLPGPKTWDDALKLIRAIAADPGDYQSLVIDTIDPLEDLAEAAVCDEGVMDHGKLERRKTIGEYSWGTGYEAAAGKWRVFLAELDQVRAKGLLVCLLGHTIVRTAQDPQLGEYDEFTSQTNKRIWAETMRWADFVGFATFNAATIKDEKRVMVTNERVLYTQRASGIQAKNRFALPPTMPFLWSALEAGIRAHQGGVQETAASVTLRIEELAKQADAKGMKTADGRAFSEKARELVVECKLNIEWLRDLEVSLQKKLASNGGVQPQGASA
jgi:hypothetical protein